jgi:D-alanyl-D-alanine dipeptidase
MKNKKSPHRILWILLAIVVLVLVWASSEQRLRPAYISIAKFENKMRGIDGISAASLAQVKGDARRHSRLIRKGFGLWGKAKEAPEENFDGFVDLASFIPDAILEIRYHTSYNFVGEPIDGYEQPTALLTREAAEALRAVSDDVMAQGYRLKIYDAYRPQCAVDHFVRWASNLPDTLMKRYFYPGVEKSSLFEEEYIMKKSGHTRGSTVDLTLFDMTTEKELDMGGTFDRFGIESHPDYTATLTPQQYANRMILRDAMVRHGFKTLDSEWWHFTLVNEPYPDTYFTFPVRDIR